MSIIYMAKKIKVLPPNDFFTAVSNRSNFVSLDIVRDVYYGMLKIIGTELRDKGAVDLPELGVLVLHKYKERNTHNVNTRTIHRLPATNIVQFKPCNNFKRYFHLLG